MKPICSDQENFQGRSRPGHRREDAKQDKGRHYRNHHQGGQVAKVVLALLFCENIFPFPLGGFPGVFYLSFQKCEKKTQIFHFLLLSFYSVLSLWCCVDFSSTRFAMIVVTSSAMADTAHSLSTIATAAES